MAGVLLRLKTLPDLQPIVSLPFKREERIKNRVYRNSRMRLSSLGLMEYCHARNLVDLERQRRSAEVLLQEWIQKPTRIQKPVEGSLLLQF